MTFQRSERTSLGQRRPPHRAKAMTTLHVGLAAASSRAVSGTPTGDLFSGVVRRFRRVAWAFLKHPEGVGGASGEERLNVSKATQAGLKACRGLEAIGW